VGAFPLNFGVENMSNLMPRPSRRNKLSGGVIITFVDHRCFTPMLHCFCISKLMYVLRSAPRNSSQLLTEYDSMIRFTLQYIMNAEVSDNVWNQETLPVASGGLGIRCATDVALQVYLSSVAGSHALITQLLPQRLHAVSGTNDSSFTAAMADWQSRLVFASVQQPFLTVQKIWDGPLGNAQVAIVQYC
jgi:hypothetical protein